MRSRGAEVLLLETEVGLGEEVILLGARRCD